MAVPSINFENTSHYGNARLETGTPIVFVVNHNRRELFSVSRAAGIERPIAQGRRLDFGPREGQLLVDDVGTDRFALYASKKTDVLRIRHETVPPGIELDPSRAGSSIRAAFYSAAELLRRAWALELDLDPAEIDLAPIAIAPTGGDPWQRQGVITLADHHPNGGGFVTELERRWKEFFPDFLAGKTRYSELILDPRGHAARCERACYTCLRGYRNRFIDGLLDWRLGYDVLRLLHDRSYRVGLDDLRGAGSPTMQGWEERTRASAEAFVSAFGAGGRYEVVSDARLPAIRRVKDAEVRFVVIKHPLWASASGVEDNLVDLTASELALEATTSNPIIVMDSFALRHRRTWVHHQIEESLEMRL